MNEDDILKQIIRQTNPSVYLDTSLNCVSTGSLSFTEMTSSKTSSKTFTRNPRNPRNPRNKKEPLLKRYWTKDNPFCSLVSYQPTFELGIDEAGRGPLFGRLYVSSVVLPNEESDFHFDWMKDSKRFSSKKKIHRIASYIKEHALAWSVQYSEPHEIDTINIRQAVLTCMHKCIDDILNQLEKRGSECTLDNTFILVDGNDFKRYEYSKGHYIPHITIEGGDNWFCSIAAASVLAKVSRDTYIESLCKEYPWLDEQYGLSSNKGYGTKQHINGIKQYGITMWHRQSFGICREYAGRKDSEEMEIVED